MLPRPLVWMIVVDTAVFVLVLVVLIFHVLPAHQVIVLLLPILFIVDALFVVFLIRSRSGKGQP